MSDLSDESLVELRDGALRGNYSAADVESMAAELLLHRAGEHEVSARAVVQACHTNGIGLKTASRSVLTADEVVSLLFPPKRRTGEFTIELALGNATGAQLKEGYSYVGRRRDDGTTFASGRTTGDVEADYPGKVQWEEDATDE